MKSVIRHYATEVNVENELLPFGGWGCEPPRYMPTGRKFLRWTDAWGKQYEEILYRGHVPREFVTPDHSRSFMVSSDSA